MNILRNLYMGYSKIANNNIWTDRVGKYCTKHNIIFDAIININNLTVIDLSLIHI